jgi:hypothetical protein
MDHNPMDKVKRNDPCPCGSGRKFKHCCLGQATAGDAAAALGPDPEITSLIADWLGDGRAKIASGVLTTAWNLLRLRLTPGMTTLRSLNAVMPKDTAPEDLVFDYVTQLDNASVHDPSCGATGVEFCEFFLRQFTDENPHHIENVRGALGQFHFRAGDPARGEETLRALIADLPHRSIGYAFLSDALGFHRYEWNGSRSLDPARAVAVLEEAVAAGVEDAGDYDLAARLNDMRREAGRA